MSGIHHNNVKVANMVVPESAHKDFPVWEQVERRMYFLMSVLHEQMLGYIKDAKTPNEV